MKNLFKAILLSVAILVSGNASALTLQNAKTLVKRAPALGASNEQVLKIKKVLKDKYLKVYLLTPDMQKIRQFVLNCPALTGDAVTNTAKTIAALKAYRPHVVAERAMLIEKITAATNATLAEIAVADLTQLIEDIDALLARIPTNSTIWPVKDDVLPLQNRKFEKITAQVILNDAIYNRIAAAANVA